MTTEKLQIHSTTSNPASKVRSGCNNSDLHLLGIYEANGHLSIRNYFDYCVAELPAFLPGWRINSSKPGQNRQDFVPGDRVGLCESWFQNYIEWPIKLKGLKSTIFHIVDQGIAWYRPFLTAGKTVVTVHDLINLMIINGHLKLGSVSRLHAVKMKFCAEQLRKADALVCVSSNTADCVQRELGVQSNRIHLVPNIVASEFRPSEPMERSRLRHELFGEAEFVILHVGKPSNYKNRTGVMEIFKRIWGKYHGCRLAITGAPLTSREVAILGKRSLIDAVSVHLLGKREQIRDLYCAADVLIFPSLYEGFGWPPLEAMACDCPVVSSSCGSLRDVVGLGGLVIDDPHDYDAIADAARQILTDTALRRELVAKGRENTLRFAKNAVFPQLAEVYRRLSN